MTQIPTTFTDAQVQTVNPFVDLPDLMKHILAHDENGDINLMLTEKHHLTPDQGDAMMRVIRNVILKTITPDQVVTALRSEAKLDPDRAIALARDLLGQRFLPMEWYLGPIQPLIEQYGGNPEEYLAEAISRYPEVYQPEADETEEEGDTPVHHLLRNFDDWVTTEHGKAEILLRLTSMSTVLGDMIQSGEISQDLGEKLVQELDSVSYAVNTRDLNSFEIHSLKRQIRRVVERVGAVQ